MRDSSILRIGQSRGESHREALVTRNIYGVHRVLTICTIIAINGAFGRGTQEIARFPVAHEASSRRRDGIILAWRARAVARSNSTCSRCEKNGRAGIASTMTRARGDGTLSGCIF